MKKSISFAMAACWILLFCAAAAQAQTVEPGKALFCKGMEKWQPIDPGTEFDTNVVSCLLRGKKAFGVMQGVLSIYRADEKGQTLLHRETLDLNPAWDALYLPDIPLPETGKFAFVLSSASGEIFSSGEVTIKEKKVEKPIPEAVKTEGTTLEGLFNKFKGQTKQ
jgi:hypothetical protein